MTTETKVREIPLTPIEHQWTFEQVANTECRNCPLWENAQVPCLTGIGPQGAAAAIFGEGPGLREDEIRRPFSGRAGKLLDKWLTQVDLDREKLFIDNVTRCFPGDMDIKDSMVQACSEYTTQILEKMPNIKYILCLGAPSAKELAGVGGKITKKRGTVVKRGGITYMVTLHPAFVLRQPQWEGQVLGDIRRFAQMVKGQSYPRPDGVNIASTLERVYEAINELKQGDFVSYDVETQGLRSWVPGHKIWSISLSNEKITWTIPLEHPQSPLKKREILSKVYEALKEFLESDITTVAQNCAFDNRWLRERGIEVMTDFDTMMAAHLLDENTSVGLKTLSSRLWGVPDYSLNVENWEEPPDQYEELLYYNGCDTYYTAKAYPILKRALEKNPKLLRLFKLLIMPGSIALSRFTTRGTYLDRVRLTQRREENRNKITALEKLMAEYIPEGETVNWNADQQVARILYDFLSLPVIEVTTAGHRSTREGVLQLIKDKHPLPQLILDYREAQKRETTYLGPWEAFSTGDSRLHFDFKLNGTVTGRRSSRMHQIPRDPFMRSIISAPPGWVVLEADLSQAELRILAELAQETTMIAEFKEGKDPHWVISMNMVSRGGFNDEAYKTADLYYKQQGLVSRAEEPITLEEAIQILTDLGASGAAKLLVDWKEIRKKAKAVGFGYSYGMGAPKFKVYAREKYEIDFTLDECKAHRKAFFAHWSGLPDYYEECRKTVHKQGYVEYLDGRRRRLPGVKSSDRGTRAEAERQAINSPVQGLVADWTLMALVELEGLVEGGRALDPTECVAVAEGHDSIRFEVRADTAAKWKTVVEEVMASPKLLEDFEMNLTVPIIADARVSTHWADPEEFFYEEVKDMTTEEREYEDREVDVYLPEEDEEPDWYIQEGTYPMKCIKAVLMESSRSKHDYVQLTLLTFAPYDNNRREITHRCSLAPKAIWNLKKTLSAMGMQAAGRISLDLDGMVGKWMMVECTDATYKGRLKTEVEDVFEMDEAPPDWSEHEEENGGDEEGSEEDFWSGEPQKEEAEDLPF